MEFANPGPDSLQLRWKLLGAEWPSGWNVDLCDYGSCYSGIPATATMVPAAPDVLPFLKLIVQPGMVAGEGSVTFRVYLAQDITQAVTVHFSFVAQGATSTLSEVAASVQAFPNPASQVLFVQYRGGKPFLEGFVLGPDGRLFGSPIRLFPGLNTLDISAWPRGLSHLLLPPVIHMPILKQ